MDITQAPAAPPHWDGRNIRFQVTSNGDPVVCAISPQALETATGKRRFKPTELLASFVATRAKIEAAALFKLGSRPHDAAHILHIWSDDIDDAQPGSQQA